MEDVKEPISNESSEKYPLLIDRIQSTFVDMFFIIVLMFVFAAILDRCNDVPNWVRIVLFVGIFIVYEPLCTTLGFTLGNYIKGIRVRQFDNSTRKINFLQAFVRYILKVALGWLSFLTIHSVKKRRAIHDMVSGSVMIKLP